MMRVVWCQSVRTTSVRTKNAIEFKLTKREALIQWIFNLNKINKKNIFNFLLYGDKTKKKNL